MGSQKLELHEAIRRGCIKTVYQCLGCNVNVNERDSAGNTPLLLAVCIKDEGIYNKVVHCLIEYGADVNVFNKGFTPLFNAVFYRRTASVEMLLKAGAWLRAGGQNEIHFIVGKSLEQEEDVEARQDYCSILQLILQDNRCCREVLNCCDSEGRPAIYLAASNGHKHYTEMLIKHGADVSYVGADGYGVIDAIFEQFSGPVAFLRGLLDNCIRGKVDDRDRCVYVLDFSVLAPPECRRQMDVIGSILEAKIPCDEEKIDLLQHPLIELYLVLKWSRICHFFYLWIAIYVVFAVSMALYVFVILEHFPVLARASLSIRCVVVMSAAGLFAHALLQTVLMRRTYWRRYELWINLVCTTLSISVGVTADLSKGTTSVPNWVLHVTSIAVLLAWIELMLLIGRLPTFGYYALMFASVLQNVVKVLFAFLCLVIGFALSFSIQFRQYDQFGDPWRALVKTIVMMTGEYEYAELFTEGQSAPGGMAATSRVLFLLFIILTSIVLMNLMVGLAVSDIQALERDSHGRKLEKQAEFLCELEKVITSKHLVASKYIPECVKRLLQHNSFIDSKFEVNAKAGEAVRAGKLPRRLLDSIVSIAKSRNRTLRK